MERINARPRLNASLVKGTLSLQRYEGDIRQTAEADKADGW